MPEMTALSKASTASLALPFAIMLIMWRFSSCRWDFLSTSVTVRSDAAPLVAPTAAAASPCPSFFSAVSMRLRSRICTPSAQMLVVTAEMTPSTLRVFHMREPRLFETATIASPFCIPATSAEPPFSTSLTTTGPPSSSWMRDMPKGFRTITSHTSSRSSRTRRFSSARARSKRIRTVGATARRVRTALSTPVFVRFSHMSLPTVADVATTRSSTHTPPASPLPPATTALMYTPASWFFPSPLARSSKVRPSAAPSSTS
mmetsp:Transcript_8319/g.31334  ORF Transcript_8319/g.31334 Transcript_8319/m.31334 type:complete len:259 (-) Transcript_8319:988-1764(-)